MKWQCRIAPSLGELESTHTEIWNTVSYSPEKDIDTPCVFMGLYGLPDFYTLWRHKGRKAILWCGSDITHFINGYFLDEAGRIKIEPEQLAIWINENCESYVENGVEHEALQVMGIESKIVPSFLGKIDEYKIEYEPSSRPRVYTSVSGNDFRLYGWGKIPDLADQFPEVEFYLYGNTIDFPYTRANIIQRGRVTKEAMNDEIREMQGALRLTEFDGCSEIIVKAMLWGQYAFSEISYPGVNPIQHLGQLKNWTATNYKRDWWIKNLNKYPWVC